MEQLIKYIHPYINKLSEKDKKTLNKKLKNSVSVYPFNPYEYTLMYLFNKKKISFKEYIKIRNKYMAIHKHIKLFTLPTREFGEAWGHQHLIKLDSRFKNPNKKIDPKFAKQYDLWIKGIRVEVKASRAIKMNKKGNLISKALDSRSKEYFRLSFQQLKLDVADVFIFIGVWTDKISYWVLTNNEVKNTSCLTHQHRGGIEYQIKISKANIREFDQKYKVSPNKIGDIVIKKGNEYKKTIKLAAPELSI